MTLNDQVQAVLDAGGDEPALAFEGRWRSWRWIKAVAVALGERLGAAGATGPVALIARNGPVHVAVFAAQLAARRATSMIYAAQSPAGMAADVVRLRPAVVVADLRDWTAEVRAAAAEVGALGVALVDDEAAPVRPVEGLEALGAGPHRSLDPAVAFELLSSGTTGPPKRVALSWQAIESATADAASVYAGTAQRLSPLLMLHPIGNVAGVSYLCPPFASGQPIVLLEKFTVAAWSHAVRTYQPLRSALPPAAVRMVLEAEVPREDLASLQVLGVGGARLDPEVQDQFEAAYGIPVLTAFGATEFGGVVANWSLDLYRQFGAAKRGSAGRASPKVTLRVVDRSTLKPAPCGEVGILEVKAERLGPQWVSTTDLAWLDEDGFLFLHGRVDDAINRGGFKVVPESVAEVLRSHPDVADAVVLGLPDARLGDVPGAAVEMRAGVERLHEAELAAYARERLLAYQVPVKWRIVAQLPRNQSMKVSLPEVRALFE